MLYYTVVKFFVCFFAHFYKFLSHYCTDLLQIRSETMIICLENGTNKLNNTPRYNDFVKKITFVCEISLLTNPVI